jgi:enoyl-CoA hydratase/carnithine racemase
MPGTISTMAQVVLRETQGAVGLITLNRPEAYNAITVELGQELEAALRELAADARVIVIRGAGGNFSVGGDFKELERLRAAGVEAMRGLFAAFARACGAIAQLPVPVIAAVEGYALAGGFELMQAADVALVRADAKLGDNHSNFGQVPGGGGSQRLPRLAGRQRALGLILSGERLTGAQAVDWGLAYRAFPASEFEAGVSEFAAKLAAKDRAAQRRIKRLVYDGLSMSLGDGLERELETVLEHLQGESAGAGIAAFGARSAR